MSNTYIVLGAAGGIGSALTKKLAGEGNRVVACVRETSEEAESLSRETGARLVALDATSFEDVDEAVKKIAQDSGRSRVSRTVSGLSFSSRLI